MNSACVARSCFRGLSFFLWLSLVTPGLAAEPVATTNSSLTAALAELNTPAK